MVAVVAVIALSLEYGILAVMNQSFMSASTTFSNDSQKGSDPSSISTDTLVSNVASNHVANCQGIDHRQELISSNRTITTSFISYSTTFSTYLNASGTPLETTSTTFNVTNSIGPEYVVVTCTYYSY